MFLSHIIVLQTSLHCLALIQCLQLTCLKQRHERMWDWLLPLTVFVTARARSWFLQWVTSVAWVSAVKLREGMKPVNAILVYSIGNAALSVLYYSNNLTCPTGPQGGVTRRMVIYFITFIVKSQQFLTFFSKTMSVNGRNHLLLFFWHRLTKTSTCHVTFESIDC